MPIVQFKKILNNLIITLSCFICFFAYPKINWNKLDLVNLIFKSYLKNLETDKAKNLIKETLKKNEYARR